MRALLALLFAAGIATAQDWHQIRVFAGINALDQFGLTDHPSIGAGYDIGLTRNLAITTGYTWNLIQTRSASAWYLGEPRDTLLTANARASLHDLMGGLRIQAPIGRVTPFVAPLGGVVIATDVHGGEAQRTGFGLKLSDSLAKPAAGIGTGFEIWGGRGWSFLVEAKAIRPLDMRWYGHLGFGFTYRTKWGPSQ